MEEQKRIIEINGIKMEVDMRTAKRIDTFKVGSPVKILDTSYTDNKILPGVIVGFAEFKSTPSIEVMVLKDVYNGIEFDFITITDSEKSNYEMVHYNNYEKLFTKSNVIDKFDKLIEKKKLEIEEIKRKKKYYVNDFQKAFEEIIVKTD